ncbi:hypothetical protein Gogos_003415 [Gossypium gossypioides]|uniref:Reverse transcriptase zinc-binding domain-containing protein n=1 Tax=Gossypium gossypioides TaxID=34282 RepID=A0A7J9CM53_GOSGO|nr:hypothetical protein [Gossypium gossypioides]
MAIAFGLMGIIEALRVSMVMPCNSLTMLFRRCMFVIFGCRTTMISSIKSHVNPACSRCKGGDETLFHALRDCPKAQDVLIANGFGNRLLVNQNNAIFRGKDEEVGVIWEKARKLNDDFQIHNLSSQPILPQVLKSCKWEKPPEWVIKVNVDAAMNSYGTSLGIIARDSDGCFERENVLHQQGV